MKPTQVTTYRDGPLCSVKICTCSKRSGTSRIPVMYGHDKIETIRNRLIEHSGIGRDRTAPTYGVPRRLGRFSDISSLLMSPYERHFGHLILVILVRAKRKKPVDKSIGFFLLPFAGYEAQTNACFKLRLNSFKWRQRNSLPRRAADHAIVDHRSCFARMPSGNWRA